MPGSRSFHLRTIAAVPQRQVYSTVAPLLRLLVCLIVVLVPLAAAAVSVAVWKSTKPVQAMTDKIRLFGKGELDVQMEPTGVAEYDEMAAVFNVMTRSRRTCLSWSRGIRKEDKRFHCRRAVFRLRPECRQP